MYQKSILDFRQGMIDDHLQDERSPIKKAEIDYLQYFEPNQDWVFQCDCEKISNPKILDVPTSSGKIKLFEPMYLLHCPKNGSSFSLTIYQNIKLRQMEAYKDYLFLPFTDESNDVTSYGGGRYIDVMTADVASGSYTLDFNKAYNPWCSYSDGFNCPIPPAENHLSFPVLAGEKKYAGEVKH